MTISLRAAGTATGATAAVTAVNPAVPAGTTTGDLSVLTVWMKPFGTTITTPGGWTKIGEATNGTTAAGTDTGSTKVAVFVRVSASTGAIGNLTLAGSPNSVGAVIHSYQNTTKSWDASSWTSGGDTTNGANYSATGAAGIDVTTGDWVFQGTAVCGDVGTLSAFTIAGMSGATLGTTVNRTNAAVTTGTDTRGVCSDIPVNSGSSSAAPTFAYTNASNTSGTTIFLRLRESGAAAGTFDFTGAATGSAAGTAAGAFDFTGAATGTLPTSAAGTFAFTGGAEGRAAATAAGTFTFTGAASGRGPGTAGGTFAFTGAASGRAPATAAGTFEFLGAASAEGATSPPTETTRRDGGGFDPIDEALRRVLLDDDDLILVGAL